MDHKIPAAKVDQLVTALRSIDGADPLLLGPEAVGYRKSPKFSADPFFTDPSMRQEWTQAIASCAGIEPPFLVRATAPILVRRRTPVGDPPRFESS